MPDSATFDVSNLVEWQEELLALPAVMQQRVVRGAVGTAASVVRKEAISRAPIYTGPVSAGHPPPGTLKAAIYQARLTSECTGTVEVFMVGVRSGKTTAGGKQNKHDAYYAHWVEYGHYTRAPGLSGTQHRNARLNGTAAALGARWVPPNPFFRPAFESKKQAATEAMQTYLNENLSLATASMRYIKAIS